MHIAIFGVVNAAYIFILLRFVTSLLKIEHKILRQLCAACISSLLLIILPLELFYIICNYIFVILCSFPRQKFFHALISMFCASMLLGGVLFALSEYWPTSSTFKILLFITLSFILLILIKRYYIQNSEVQKQPPSISISLHLFQKQWNAVGFIDTGNRCVEPISQYPVHFVQSNLLTEEEFAELVLPYQLRAHGYEPDFPLLFSRKIRFIPIQTINDQKSKTVVGFLGKVSYLELSTPCYFVFVDNQSFPHEAEVLLHCSFAEIY